MGKMKEATMEITEYVMENLEDFFTDSHIATGITFEQAQDFVMAMDEETFYVNLMLATPSRKEGHAV